MTKEYDTVLEAKKSLRVHIEFFEELLKHLKCPDKVLRNRAVWATWCLHNYIDTRLIGEIQDAIRQNIPSEGKDNA